MARPIAAYVAALAAALAVGGCSFAGGGLPFGDAEATADAASSESDRRPDLAPPDDLVLARELVAESPEQVTALATRPGDHRLFAGDKRGRIWIVEDGELRQSSWLNISDRVISTTQREEQGFLTMAFHPDAPDDDRLFVYYVPDDGTDNTRLSSFTLTDGEVDDPDDEQIILELEQPFRWHNGGQLVFGPDGMLWLSLGDGGVAGDPDLHAQDPHSLLGSIIRIDVDRVHAGNDPPYAIPDDNPYVDGIDGAPEVWAKGLRNPWRMVIDPVDATVYTADVGQSGYEWVNVVGLDQGGVNFGWPIIEASTCFPGHQELCPGEGFTDPVLEYSHDDPEICAIIGGIVYDGPGIPELRGHYLYGDLCAGWVRSFRYVDGEARHERDWSEGLGRFDVMVTFGIDVDGEPLVSDGLGAIWRIVPGSS